MKTVTFAVLHVLPFAQMPIASALSATLCQSFTCKSALFQINNKTRFPKNTTPPPHHVAHESTPLPQPSNHRHPPTLIDRPHLHPHCHDIIWLMIGNQTLPYQLIVIQKLWSKTAYGHQIGLISHTYVYPSHSHIHIHRLRRAWTTMTCAMPGHVVVMTLSLPTFHNWYACLASN